MNIPPFINNPQYEDNSPFEFTNLLASTGTSSGMAFDPYLFRLMLDDPAQRISFEARHPTAKSLFEEYLEATRPTFPTFPTDGITALQITVFDNGQPQLRTSKAKRPRPRNGPLTMSSRFGLNAKVWDRIDVNWSKKHHLAWEANAFLWSPQDTLQITQELLDKGHIAEPTAETIRQYAKAAGPELLFSVFSQKEPRLGSRWTDVVAVVFMEQDFPQKVFMLLEKGKGYEAGSFDPCDAGGKPLGGKAVGQARVPMSEKFERWGTEAVQRNG